MGDGLQMQVADINSNVRWKLRVQLSLQLANFIKI